jgi:fermentation-respiration switch protein FrsA (DUF1100 family)
MKGRAIRVMTLALVACLSVLALAYIFQRRLQYFPDPRPVGLPKGIRYQQLREVALRTADEVDLKAWYWPGSNGVTLLIFHGNAGHRADRLPWIASFHQRGYGVFLLDYRGYGGSSGRPSEAGLYRDAAAAWDCLRQLTSDRIVVLGESIGSGVAVELCRHETPAALVIHSGFTSAVDVGKQAYPFLPVKWLLKDRFDNAAKLAGVRCPLLVIHGERDSIIPASHGRRLYELANPPKELYLISGADHNDLLLVGSDDYYNRIDAFLQSHVEGP